MQMRRGFSILLILVFGFGPLSAMVDGSEDAGLPACCRRHGAHHCAMTMQTAGKMARTADPQPSFTAPSTCPNYPGLVLAILLPNHALAAAQTSRRVPPMQAPVPAFEHASAYATPSRSHAVRGPPATNLS
jgi:hypothetical protein